MQLWKQPRLFAATATAIFAALCLMCAACDVRSGGRGNGGSELPYATFDGTTGTITRYDEDGPKDVVIPSKINGVPVTSIGNWAFGSKQLTSVTIPDSVTTIERGAFASKEQVSKLLNSCYNT